MELACPRSKATVRLKKDEGSMEVTYELERVLTNVGRDEVKNIPLEFGGEDHGLGLPKLDRILWERLGERSRGYFTGDDPRKINTTSWISRATADVTLQGFESILWKCKVIEHRPLNGSFTMAYGYETVEHELIVDCPDDGGHHFRVLRPGVSSDGRTKHLVYAPLFRGQAVQVRWWPSQVG